MFKLSQANSYRWPIDVRIPVDGGKYEKSTFDAVFKRLPQSKIREIQDRVAAEELDDVQFAKEVMIGWAGVQTDENVEIPFSVQAFDQFLEIPGMGAIITKAYIASIKGSLIKN